MTRYKLIVCIFCFFFKQKTAYEMRISDWSSDVCSSDLRVRDSFVQEHLLVEAHRLELLRQHQRAAFFRFVARDIPPAREVLLAHRGVTQHLRIVVRVLLFARRVDDRSEEHTSELQSLMRISYAVFCLKKKTKPQA